VRRALLAAVLCSVAAAAPAAASEERPTLAELEREVMCPTCEGQTLDQSNAPAAARVKAFIRERIRAGDTKSEIEAKLVADFGPAILAAPPRSGVHLLAWVLPLLGLLVGAVAVGVGVWRWSRVRASEPPEPVTGVAANGRVPLEPELERRLEEELARFD
jgi:cytochrome c-type biogenesis protein CcmH